MPATEEGLFARLSELGIETETVRHPAVFTVEESKALRGDLPGGHTKNLFFKDKNGDPWQQAITGLEAAKHNLRNLINNQGQYDETQ